MLARYGEVKRRLLELLEETFSPFRERRRELERDPGYVEDVLRDGDIEAVVHIGAAVDSRMPLAEAV